jgi:hypothetical protein
VRKGGCFNYCVQRDPHWSFHAVLPLARTFLCKKKLPGNGKEFCCQQGNKDITLFLINPRIIAIPKQIRVRKCKKIQILLLLLWNGKSEKILRDDLKPPVMKFLYN